MVGRMGRVVSDGVARCMNNNICTLMHTIPDNIDGTVRGTTQRVREAAGGARGVTTGASRLQGDQPTATNTRYARTA